MPPGKLIPTLARLHREAAGALGTYVARPNDEEAAARRDVTACSALGELLSQLARPPRAVGPSADGGEEGSR